MIVGCSQVRDGDADQFVFFRQGLRIPFPATIREELRRKAHKIAWVRDFREEPDFIKVSQIRPKAPAEQVQRGRVERVWHAFEAGDATKRLFRIKPTVLPFKARLTVPKYQTGNGGYHGDINQTGTTTYISNRADRRGARCDTQHNTRR